MEKHRVLLNVWPHETGASHDFPGEHGDTKTEEDPDGRAEAMMVQPGQWKGWWMGGGGH